MASTKTHRTEAPELEALQRNAGNSLALIPLDVTDEFSIAKAAARTKLIMGRVHLLVHMAGFLNGEGMTKSAFEVGRA